MNKKTEQQLLEELEKASDELDEAFNSYPPGRDYEEFREFMQPYNEKYNQLSREYRMIKTPTFDELPNYGDVMELKEFVIDVESGYFIDYDGFGHYVRDGKESDIEIYPSDVKKGYIRTDFDTIIWYNR